MFFSKWLSVKPNTLMSGASSPHWFEKAFIIICNIIIHMCSCVFLDVVFTIALGWGPRKQALRWRSPCSKCIGRSPWGQCLTGKRKQNKAGGVGLWHSHSKGLTTPLGALELGQPCRVVLPEARALAGLYPSPLTSQSKDAVVLG